MAGWIKMSLDMEVGLGRGDFVLDGDPAPPPQKEGGVGVKGRRVVTRDKPTHYINVGLNTT